MLEINALPSMERARVIGDMLKRVYRVFEAHRDGHGPDICRQCVELNYLMEVFDVETYEVE